MKLIEAISLRIKELMQERNITQYRLGQVCNIPHTSTKITFHLLGGLELTQEINEKGRCKVV